MTTLSQEIYVLAKHNAFAQLEALSKKPEFANSVNDSLLHGLTALIMALVGI